MILDTPVGQRVIERCVRGRKEGGQRECERLESTQSSASSKDAMDRQYVRSTYSSPVS
jgi:hypothetical protein